MERQIDFLRKKFLWSRAYKAGNGFSLVNWKRVCTRKEFGGQVSSTSETLILLYSSSAAGNFLTSMVINGHPSFTIIIGPSLGDGLTDVLTGVPLPLFGKV